MTAFAERRAACATDTRYVVQASGYAWAMRHLHTGRRSILDGPPVVDATARSGRPGLHDR